MGVQRRLADGDKGVLCRECSWKKPHFFKVLIGDFHERLQIPPAFLKHISVGESGTAVVKHHADKCWNIKLLRRENRIIFEQGWKKFVEENDLDTGDFLVFRYDGELHFTVTIFDKSSCEKVQCVDKSAATPTADPIIADDDHGQSADVNVKTKHPKTKARDEASSLKNRITNRTFSRMITDAHVHRLFIPLHASNATWPEKTCWVKLENSNGRQWRVKYIKTFISIGGHRLRRQRTTLGSGWHDFYEENCLKKRDVCVFEYIARRNLFKVQIVRHGKE